MSDKELTDQRISTDDVARTQPVAPPHKGVRHEEVHALKIKMIKTTLLAEKHWSDSVQHEQKIQVSFVDEPRR